MRALDELRRADPKWQDALDRMVAQIAEHLVSQRVGCTPGRMDVSLNWGGGPNKPPLKIELKPVRVIAS